MSKNIEKRFTSVIVSVPKNISKGESHISSLLEKSLNLEGGNLTSDAGIILYR